MKKTIILCFLMFMMAGCTIVRIDTDNIDTTINVVLSKENTLYNRVGKGYKYYVPRGVNYIDTNDFNDKLYSDGDYYYLYVDAIRYFYKKEDNHTFATTAYYQREIDMNGKTGYVEIAIIGEDQYFIEFTYNYAKIETVVSEDKIEQVILNASYILSTVKFNDNVIKIMLDDDYFIHKEEKYDLFSSQQQTNNFLEYVEDNNIESES